MSIAKLLLATHSDDSEERAIARGALQDALTNSCEVLNEYLESPDPLLRRAAACAISLVEFNQQQVRLLARALKDSDDYVVAYACWAIEEIGEPNLDLWTGVCRGLSNANWHVRQAALSALPFCNADTEVKLKTISACPADTVWQVRAQIPFALVEMRIWNGRVAEILKDLLTDQEAGVRSEATQALAKLEPEMPFIRDALPPLLDDEDWDVRVYACEIAAQYGENCKFAREALERNRLLTYPELQRVAKLALKSICGK